ncbi:MAG TPA: NAD(P)-binding protein, partial [Gemmatales bacterium]|nr:NAD(P)-binding protein [Gemmatales bacterium]
MSLKVSNLRLGVDSDERELPQQLARALGVLEGDLLHWRILRKSLDARDPDDLSFVYATEVSVADETGLFAQQRNRAGLQIAAYEPDAFEFPPPGNNPLPHRPVIIGSGPAGIAAAYFLAERGYRPIVLERGAAVSERIRDVRAFDEGGDHNPESNYLFGEGGAGTFSDGKLTCRMSGPDVQRVLQFYAEHKGKPSILYDHRPHLGSNRLPAVVKAQRQRIEALGGEVRFHCCVTDLDLADGQIRGVTTTSGYIPASVVILAIGHSARDTYEMLYQRGVPMMHKPFQIGVRIEHPQQNTNRQCYGPRKLEEKLGSASYSVIQKTGTGLDLFSFCMCAGGYVMPSVSEPGAFCTNGMSLSKRDSPYANSGLVVTLGSEHFGSTHPLAGMYLQRQYEKQAHDLSQGRYACPIQWAKDFLQSKKSEGKLPSSYPRETLSSDVAGVIPPVIAKVLREALPVVDRRWQGRFLKEATLVGPESRGSAPVRIPRDQANRQTTGIQGLYPVGEGAGYAGGIISAAVDGLRTAKAIVA